MKINQKEKQLLKYSFIYKHRQKENNSIISYFNDSKLNEEKKDLINIELLLLNILNNYKNRHK
jgi:hypothetical protein